MIKIYYLKIILVDNNDLKFQKIKFKRYMNDLCSILIIAKFLKYDFVVVQESFVFVSSRYDFQNLTSS
jgi:hypothetical protein